MNSISSHAVVQTSDVGEGTRIDEFAVIRASARLGRGVIVHPYVFIGEGVSVGDGVEIFPGSVLGKEPKGAGATARQPQFERRVSIGNNTSIGPHAVIFYDVTIGDNTLIGDGASIREQCRIGSKCIISRYVTINYHTSIGDRVKIMDQTHITGNSTIEDDVFISLLVGSANDNTPLAEGYEESRIVGCTIEKGALIGAGTTLMPGVVIGAGGMVGAGSVVSKNVEPNTLVIGSPARFVRRLGE